MKGRIAWLCMDDEGFQTIKMQEPDPHWYYKVTPIVYFELESSPTAPDSVRHQGE